MWFGGESSQIHSSSVGSDGTLDTSFPTFDRDELVALLEAEGDIREGQTVSADDARKRFGTDGDE